MSNRKVSSGLQAILHAEMLGGVYGLYTFAGIYGFVGRFDYRGESP